MDKRSRQDENYEVHIPVDRGHSFPSILDTHSQRYRLNLLTIGDYYLSFRR